MANNIDQLLRTPWLETIDPETVAARISSPPFLQAEGLFNLRDISTGPPGSIGGQTGLKQGYVFRCGSLENITEQGKVDLRNLGIKTIFDLRSERETSAFPDPKIEGIETVEAVTDTDPMGFVKFENVCGAHHPFFNSLLEFPLLVCVKYQSLCDVICRRMERRTDSSVDVVA